MGKEGTIILTEIFIALLLNLVIFAVGFNSQRALGNNFDRCCIHLAIFPDICILKPKTMNIIVIMIFPLPALLIMIYLPK